MMEVRKLIWIITGTTKFKDNYSSIANKKVFILAVWTGYERIKTQIVLKDDTS